MAGLPIFWNLALCLAAAAMGIGMGWRAHRREPVLEGTHLLRHSPHLWAIVLLPLALLVFHVTFVLRPRWEWLLPYAVQYYYAPAAWGLLLGCFTYFAGFGGIVFRQGLHPRRHLLATTMLFLFLALQQFHGQVVRHIPPAVRDAAVTPEGFTYQTSPETCVPAAAATLLASLGDPRSEAELVELLGTDVNGTLPSQLVMAMRRLGYRESTYSIDRDGLEGLPVPAILFLRDNAHSVTLLRLDERRAVIWNPAPPSPGGPPGGRLIIDRSAFTRYFAGAHAISFERRSLSPQGQRRAARLGF